MTKLLLVSEFIHLKLNLTSLRHTEFAGSVHLYFEICSFVLCWLRSEDRGCVWRERICSVQAVMVLTQWLYWLYGIQWLCFCEIQVLSCKWRLSCFAQVLHENIWSFTYSQCSYPAWLHFCMKQRRRSVLRLVCSFHFKSLAGSCSLLFHRQDILKFGLLQENQP